MKLKKMSDTFAIGGLNADSKGSFTIKASGHAFRILSDGLYTRKIRAVIRELMCNADDSHVEAGVDLPFHVYLPTYEKLIFVVEDFGLGLSDAQVMKLYTTYFESTKQDSNELVGALGLGSKSPFSYTSSFRVISTYEGVRNTYNAFVDDSYLPSILKIKSENVDAPNGVKIELKVFEKDVQEFMNEFVDLVGFFKRTPKVMSHNVQPQSNLLDSIYQHDNVTVYRDRNYNTRILAKQGNVAYPVDLTTLSELSDDQKSVLFVRRYTTTVIEFPIGSLDIAASREQLSLDEGTIDALSSAIKKVNDDFVGKLNTELDECSTLIEAIRLLYSKKENLEIDRYLRSGRIFYKTRTINEGLVKNIFRINNNQFVYNPSRSANVFKSLEYIAVWKDIDLYINDMNLTWNKVRELIMNSPSKNKIVLLNPTDYRQYDAFRKHYDITPDQLNLISALQKTTPAPAPVVREKVDFEEQRIFYVSEHQGRANAIQLYSLEDVRTFARYIDGNYFFVEFDKVNSRSVSGTNTHTLSVIDAFRVAGSLVQQKIPTLGNNPLVICTSTRNAKKLRDLGVQNIIDPQELVGTIPVRPDSFYSRSALKSGVRMMFQKAKVFSTVLEDDLTKFDQTCNNACTVKHDTLSYLQSLPNITIKNTDPDVMLVELIEKYPELDGIDINLGNSHLGIEYNEAVSTLIMQSIMQRTGELS